MVLSDIRQSSLEWLRLILLAPIFCGIVDIPLGGKHNALAIETRLQAPGLCFVKRIRNEYF
jgi:hypothetical protein